MSTFGRAAELLIVTGRSVPCGPADVRLLDTQLDVSVGGSRRDEGPASFPSAVPAKGFGHHSSALRRGARKDEDHTRKSRGSPL